MNQTSFLIVKPDAIERGLLGEIISRFERKYFRLTSITMRHKTLEWATRHYSHLLHDPFYSDLAHFMTSAPLVGFTLTGPSAIEVVRAMVGTTDSLKAPPGSIRGDYGYAPVMYNCIHASDSQEAAEREYNLFNDPNTDCVA